MRCVAQHGTVDVLVNNAGVGHTVSIEDETLDVFRNAIEVNLTALWHLSKLAGEVMVAQRRGQHREHRVDARRRRVDAREAGALQREQGRGHQPLARDGRVNGRARACG